MRVIDVFIWSYERDAVDIRLRNLMGICGGHVAVQATNTFRGDLRVVHKLDLSGVHDVIVTIPDGLSTWDSEKWLRDESLRQAHAIYGDDVIYMVSDGDEIPHTDGIIEAMVSDTPLILPTDYRNFFANWRAKDHQLVHQPTIATYSHYESAGGANDARWYGHWQRSESTGWHLSSLGTDNNVIKEKLETFAHIEYDTDEIKNNLNNARAEMKDFLGRFELEYTNDIPKGVPLSLLAEE